MQNLSRKINCFDFKAALMKRIWECWCFSERRPRLAMIEFYFLSLSIPEVSRYILPGNIKRTCDCRLYRGNQLMRSMVSMVHVDSLHTLWEGVMGRGGIWETSSFRTCVADITRSRMGLVCRYQTHPNPSFSCRDIRSNGLCAYNNPIDYHAADN